MRCKYTDGFVLVRSNLSAKIPNSVVMTARFRNEHSHNLVFAGLTRMNEIQRGTFKRCCPVLSCPAWDDIHLAQ